MLPDQLQAYSAADWPDRHELESSIFAQENTVIDLYTKTILTVIAAALVGIAAQQAIPGATAQPSSTCGQEANPCAVFMMTWGGTKWVRCDDLAPRVACFPVKSVP
jgi:hypothetical protein